MLYAKVDEKNIMRKYIYNYFHIWRKSDILAVICFLSKWCRKVGTDFVQSEYE